MRVMRKVSAVEQIAVLSDATRFVEAFRKMEMFSQPALHPSVISAIESIRKVSVFEYDFSKVLEIEEDSKEEEIFIDETKRIKSIITDIYHNNSLLHTIEPRNFEEVVAELLFSQGFKVELTKQTRDNGFDIIALKYIDGHIPFKFLVECKRHKEKIGVEIVRSFKEVIQTEKANRGIIIATSYFTAGAKKKQEEMPYLLDLRDKDHVIQWVNDYYSLKA